jgi:serine/threonine protein kinase
MTTPFPSKIGKYDVTGVIGRGGMGVVYQATDPHLDRRVAIKMITGAFSENPDMLKRFFREAQSLGSLQHPNIVTVFDLGDFGGNPYFVMEFLEGEGLDVLLAKCQLNLLEKISIMIQVCAGLAYAHRRGVIHRDIKPANIMINKDGGVKIFDFGIAHAGQTNVTRTGEVIGTLRYMAPEQINSKTVDSRTDIFSTGVVLYQLITDHLPFDGDNTASTLMKIVSEAPPPLGNFLTAYPPEMEEILLKALAKNPNERYATADDFAMDLAQLQGQLKEELIGSEMQEVALLIDQGEVYKAQSSLQRVLKIDQQHTRANRLLREVQQRIQRDELGKQVRGLRERAEQALADEQFDQAMEHVDRALGLDRDNFDLMQLREAIREAVVRAEKLHNALKAAEAAQAEGKLDAAKDAVEAALAVAPNDTQAKTLYRLISREMEERARHEQVEGYLLEARQELSSRKFTAALVILKQAEELDPVSPQVHSLIESATAGQEQERRRRELEAVTREVEEALNLDDYRTACEKADEGLAKFPYDRNLLKLKGMGDRQRLVEERRQFVDQLLAEARPLLQAGRNEELKSRLETALSQIGAEPRLQSLLAVVIEKLQREQMESQRTERLQQARESLGNKAYDDAVQTLEAQAREMGDDPEVQDLLSRARLEQAEAVQGALVRAQQESVLDVRVKILEEALRQSPRDVRVKEQLHQARNLNQVITKIVAEARKLEEDRQYDQALAKWETVSAVYQHYPDLKGILKRVRDLRDRALTSAKQSWIDRIEGALAACDYDQATSLLGPATQAFPWDSDLMGLQERTEAGTRQRAKAQKMLAEGRKAFAAQQWDAGAQLMVRAYQAASQDVLIRDQAVSELAQASRATIDKDWQASELILRRLAEIEPSAAHDLQATIQERKREETIVTALNATRRQQAVGDLQGALREVGEAISSYPDERRLRDLQAQLEERVQQARDAARLQKQAREQEIRDQEQRELEIRQRQAKEQEAREKEKRDREQRASER